MNTPVIQIKHLSKSFGSLQVLKNIDFHVNSNESFVIIGGSGSGKSVLIKCVLGLLEKDSGDILFRGENILRQKDYEEILRDIGFLFQGNALFDSLTIWENIAFGLIYGMKMKKSQAKEIAYEKLKIVDLPESVGNLYPNQISGGMQKRVGLARSVANNPKIIFFDEPTTGLDPIVSQTINKLIIHCVRDIGASAITITHDMTSLKYIADRIGLLYEGTLTWTGTLEEFKSTTHPQVEHYRSAHLL